MINPDVAAFYLTVTTIAFILVVTLYFYFAERMIDIEDKFHIWWYEYTQRRIAERQARQNVHRAPLIAINVGGRGRDYVQPDEPDDHPLPDDMPEPLPNALEPGSEPTGTDRPEPTGTQPEPDIVELTREQFIAELARVMRPNKHGVYTYLTIDEIASVVSIRRTIIADIVRTVREVQKKKTPEPYQFERVGPSSYVRTDIKR